MSRKYPHLNLGDVKALVEYFRRVVIEGVLVEQKKKKVLYQKIGKNWYAFTLSDAGEPIYTKIPDEVDISEMEVELVETRKNPKISAK